MDTNKRNRNNHKGEQKPSAIMKFFYLIMLLLIVSTSILSLAGANHRNANAQSAAVPTPNNPPVGGGTSALVLVFHREASSSGQCVDLTITFAGSAVYSDCNKGVNARYMLSASEQAQLHDWINQFQQINYDHTDKTQAGNVTDKLYLNGQGSQQAGDANTQQIMDFAMTLATKIASQP